MTYEKPKVTLECSQNEFESIHETLHKARANSKVVKVDKQALVRLLIDHSTILNEIEYD